MSSALIEVVALALQRASDKKYLLARRGPGQSGAGHWEFPGGKIEKDETQQMALVREIDEELAFRIDQAKLTFVASQNFQYPTKLVNLHLWKLVTDENDFQFTLSEHDQIMWCAPNEMKAHDLSPGDIFFVDKLL